MTGIKLQFAHNMVIPYPDSQGLECTLCSYVTGLRDAETKEDLLCIAKMNEEFGSQMMDQDGNCKYVCDLCIEEFGTPDEFNAHIIKCYEEF